MKNEKKKMKKLFKKKNGPKRHLQYCNTCKSMGWWIAWTNINELIKSHGDNPFHLFKYMSFVKNLIVSKSGMFTIEVPSWRESLFLENLKKKCYIQVKKRRTEKEPLDSEFLDEIYISINVFK